MPGLRDGNRVPLADRGVKSGSGGRIRPSDTRQSGPKRSGGVLVPMMEAADLGEGDHATSGGRPDVPGEGVLAVKGEVRIA